MIRRILDIFKRKPKPAQLTGRERQRRALKAKWADPDWRERQIKRVAAGKARKRRGTKKET